MTTMNYHLRSMPSAQAHVEFVHELFGCNYYFECKEAWANESPLAEVLYNNAIMNFWNEYRQYGKHFNY
jgi:hypothetical protein